MTSAVAYMHSVGIVHRDLKMENILLDDAGSVKIIDLGLGNFFDMQPEGELKLLDTFCGSADYAAPELWEGSKYKGPEVDVWSLGVILYILTTGFLPFNDSTRVMSIAYRWPKTVKLSDSIKHLIGKIFVTSDKRISMDELMKHPWLNEGFDKPVEIIPSSVTVIDHDVIKTVEIKFGFRSADIYNSVVNNERNQFSMIYWIFKNFKEQKEAKGAQEQKKKKFITPHHEKKAEKSDSGSEGNSNAKCNIQ